MTSPEITEAFRSRLNQMRRGWKTRDDMLVGRGGATLRISRGSHSDSPRHLDVGFGFRLPNGKAFEIWDCVTGFGDADAAIGRSAAHIWASTTGTAAFELQYSRKGKYATHYRGWEPDGLTGWHAIAGNVLAYGHGEHAAELQEWWLENPPLPVIADALGDALGQREEPDGLKLLICGEVAEVSLNGGPNDAASRALSELDWPRLQPAAMIRTYVFALHRESGSP